MESKTIWMCWHGVASLCICLSLAVRSCVFGTGALNAGNPAQGQFEGCCVWCCPSELQRRCENGRLRKLLSYTLTQLNKYSPGTVHLAIKRIPSEWRFTVAEGAVGVSLEDMADEGAPMSEDAVSCYDKPKCDKSDSTSSSGSSNSSSSSSVEDDLDNAEEVHWH